MNNIAYWIVLLSLCAGLGQGSRAQTPESSPASFESGPIKLSFQDSPLDLVLAMYEQITGRVMLRAPGLNAQITLMTKTPIPREEALAAIETELAMNGIGIVPMGDRFSKVVTIATVRQEGLLIGIGRPSAPLPASDAVVSRVIELTNVTVAEVQPILQKLIRGTGQLQPIERSNSLLITDTSVNMQRILDVLDYLDRPAESRVETRVYELKYAKASDVVARLNELIADSQTQDNARRSVRTASPPVPPGVIRPPTTTLTTEATEMAERGVVSGQVKLVADERTNIMIVISPPANFVFFDRVISVLDRPMDPEVIVRVLALDYADAEEVATLLGQFLGKTSSSTSAPTQPPAAGDATDVRGQILREFIARRAQERAQAETASNSETAIGSLSPDTKILADKRSNALLIMGRRQDVESLLPVVEQLDVMLAQVMIEAVILEVSLGKDVQYGFDWLQKSITMYQKGSGGAAAGARPVAAFGGGYATAASPGFLDATTVTRDVPLSSAGLTYYMTLFNLNLDTILRMAAKSDDARVLSTPVIMTTDNTEASIISTEQRPVVTQTSTTTAGELRSSYEYRDIGIKLKVKPRINPDGYVVLEITTTSDIPGADVLIDNNLVPKIYRRELQASIAVPNRGTVALGGLIQKDDKKSRSKVPILGDIPLLGWLFRSDARSEARTELLVLITPYVITSPEEARRETTRMHDRSAASNVDWQSTWSDGDLARERRAQAATLSLRNRRGASSGPDAPVEQSQSAPEPGAPPASEPAPVAQPGVPAPGDPAVMPPGVPHLLPGALEAVKAEETAPAESPATP